MTQPQERRDRRSRDRFGRDRRERTDRQPQEQSDFSSTGADATHTSALIESHAQNSTVASAPQVQAMPQVGHFSLPVNDLILVAQASGLEWVNSDPQKVATVQAAIAAEPVAIRIPRERPAPVIGDEGPLILVETKKDLGQMAMSFDKGL